MIEMIKTIKITPPGSIPPDKLQQYNELKERYIELTQKETRTDSDRKEMASLIFSGSRIDEDFTPTDLNQLKQFAREVSPPTKK